MKYIPEDIVIPTERRKEINEKIFHIIKNNVECDITKNDIFNSFTGKGGTHGLKFEDYRNYSEFRQAKNEVDYGQYFTKPSQVQFIYDVIKPTKDDILGDLTAGHGNFINSCPNEHNFYANELDLQAYTVAKHLYPDAKISNMDIQHYEPATFLSILFGNPPFNQDWGVRSEMYYCQKAAKVLRPAGLLVMIAPVAFCADEFSDKWMIKELNENFNYVCQIALDKNLFKHLGVEISTKLMVLQKKSEYLEDTEFKTEILDVTDSEFLHDTYIKPIMEVQRKLRAKLFNESIKENSLYEQQIKKLLFDIKRNQKTTNRLTECHELVNQFFTQTKPDYMKSDEWEKKKLTKEKVLQQLKDVLKSQNPVKPQLDRLIKDSYQIRYNGMVYQINDLVTGNEYPFEDKTLMGLINKKRRQYINQSRDFTKALVNKNEWLENFRLKTSKDIIKFNEIQQHDVNLFMQKKYGFIQWEQGGGKTAAGIAIGQYRMAEKHVRNVFVVSTAISIDGTWDESLEDADIDYVCIRSMSDIYKIKDGQFVIVSLGYLSKYQKQIKKAIKMRHKNIQMIFDESDSISNNSAQCTKAVLNCFRKARYKINMTGTSTRNNLRESFPQIQLLYNNSFNMMCECNTIYFNGKATVGKGELYSEVELNGINHETNKNLCSKQNPMYGIPFPAYKKGLDLFAACFNPEKITVLGIAQFNQDIFNAEILKKMVNKTIITRSFDEIVGRKIYDIKQATCSMSPEEETLYVQAVEEFETMEYLFNSTGNSKKDAMLRLLHQLLLMLKICAAAQTIRPSIKETKKFEKVDQLVTQHEHQRVAIGVRNKDVAQQYFNYIHSKHPERPIFLVTGEKYTVKQRKKICEIIANTENGIMISTQQSLSSSMNIDCIDICIIPQLHWNNEAMSQYYHRFIRFDSVNYKTVYYVTYKQSIEINLLKMVMCKTQLNLFMKNREVDEMEVYEIYGLAKELFDNLAYRHTDKEGRTQIRWGKQKIS